MCFGTLNMDLQNTWNIVIGVIRKWNSLIGNWNVHISKINLLIQVTKLVAEAFLFEIPF